MAEYNPTTDVYTEVIEVELTEEYNFLREMNLQEKTTEVNGIITPDVGMDALSKVTVAVPLPEGSIDITENGTVDVTMKETAIVNVPNTYTQADEGKVVSSGALTSQTSTTKTANGTYDTTLNDQVVINVPNSYSASDEGKVVSQGTLVSQTSATVTESGTYDTTLNNQLVVSVPPDLYDADEGKVVHNRALMTQGSDTVTENDTYDTTYISSLTVDVHGGNGVIVSKDLPTSEDGRIGDIWVRYYKGPIKSDGTHSTTFTLTITKCLRDNQNLDYGGASELDIILDDGEGNEVSMRGLSGFTKSANKGTINNAFDNNSSTYWEGNPMSLIVYMTATLPAGYFFKNLKVMQRSSSFQTDVWSNFTLKQSFDGFSQTHVDKSGLKTANWAGAWKYTYFPCQVPADQTSIINTYIKVGETEQDAEWIATNKIEVTIVDPEE